MNAKSWRLLLLIAALGAFSTGAFTSASAQAVLGQTPHGQQSHPADPNYKFEQVPPSNRPIEPDHLIHPCSGMDPQPAFEGLSPLSIAYVSGMCSSGSTWGYGDIGVWQAGGHSYVVLSGFNLRMFHIWNVDDPYNPAPLVSQSFPSGGTTSTSVFPFKQGSNRYISVTMRGSGTGCGYFVYNVNDPANPSFVTRFQGTDWCTPHEHFVSTDANGDADYAWVAMSGESGSGYKMVILDLRSLPQITETGRYQRPDANGSIFVHDVTVIGNRVFLAHWGGGLIIHDKETLAHSINPTPLNPIDSIRPSGFNVHHSWPTSDGNHVFIEDEVLNSSSVEKVRLYNISNIAAPFYETGIIGPGTAANSQAHNLKILNQSPGQDLLFVGWYKAGTRGFQVDTTGPSPVITATISHQLRQTAGPGYGDVWGVDYQPCTLHGSARTCVYSGDMNYGLVADALGYDPTLDPYPPESQITDPVSGQTITTCSYTIRGNAHDYWTSVTGVEVSTDGGSTWQPATGTTNWTYQWTISGDRAYVLKARARDEASNVEAPTSFIKVVVLGGCGSGTATPTSAVTLTPTNPPNPTATSTPIATATATAQPSRTATPTTTPTPCTITFTDVHQSDYFYEPVRYLYCRGIISGYNANTFRPYNDTTRGQLAKVVVLAEAWTIYTPPTPTFTDVPTTQTFYQYIETAYHQGIVSGYSCGTGCLEFRPGDNVTRGQLCKIVVLAEGWAIYTPPAPTFRDVPTTQTFYQYIETAYSHGIISGYSCGTGCLEFRPSNNGTRGQISKIVYNAVTQP